MSSFNIPIKKDHSPLSAVTEGGSSEAGGMSRTQKLSMAALALAGALLVFSAGYLAGQRPIDGAVQIARMAVPDPIAPSASPDGLIDINAASAVELADIPGIGPVLAERIIAYRAANGAFSRPEDLLAVKGIGDKVLARISVYITYGGTDEDFGG